MSRLTNFIRSLFAAGALLPVSISAAQAFPDQPIVIIVPTQAGGNVDSTARLFARAIDEQNLLPVPVVIKNMPGSGGVVGTRALRDAEPDGYTIGLWNLSLSASQVLGVSDFGLDSFEIIAQTGSAATVIATQADGKFDSLDEVIAFARDNGGNVLDATNIGTMPFFSTLILAQRAGVQFRPVQTGGGAERLKAILGGHADIAVFGTSVYKQHAGGGLQALAILSEERDPTLPEVPTARELGYDVVFDNPDLWLAPSGTPEANIEVIREALKKASESDLVQQGLQDANVLYRSGPELKADIALREAALAETGEIAIKAVNQIKPK